MRCLAATLTDAAPYSATLEAPFGYVGELDLSDVDQFSATIADVPSLAGELTDAHRFSATLEDC